MKKKEGEEESLLYDSFCLNIDSIITHVSSTPNPPIGCYLIPGKILNHYIVIATETYLIGFLTMTPPVHLLPHSLLLKVSCTGFTEHTKQNPSICVTCSFSLGCPLPSSAHISTWLAHLLPSAFCLNAT